MIKIYGKPNCSFCVAAKQLLNNRGVAYDYLELGSDFTVEEIRALAPGAQSFPQIFNDSVLIGGFQDLQRQINEIEKMDGPGTLLG